MSKVEELSFFKVKQQATPPQTPATAKLAAAQLALLEYEVKVEKRDAGMLGIGVGMFGSAIMANNGDVMERAKYTAAVRAANMEVMAEQQIAVPRWNEFLSQAENQLLQQQSDSANLLAQDAQKKTLTVAVAGLLIVGSFILMETL